MDLGEPPVLPSIRLPEPPVLPRPVLEVPRADLPSYKPLVVPPSNLKPPPGVRGTTTTEKETTTPKIVTPPPPVSPSIPPIPQVRYLDIPNTDVSVPLPSNEILATATTTATVSVAATLTATALFKRTVSILKPIIKKLVTRKKIATDQYNGEED